ncbi:MAG: hypothetical protein Q7S15_00005 [bacterium]|nr:hypothetical protein [bacterium]
MRKLLLLGVLIMLVALMLAPNESRADHRNLGQSNAWCDSTRIEVSYSFRYREYEPQPVYRPTYATCERPYYNTETYCYRPLTRSSYTSWQSDYRTGSRFLVYHDMDHRRVWSRYGGSLYYSRYR